MSTRLKQDALALAFPSGDSRPIAVLADEPSSLARRLGLRFSEGLDDLDRFRYAIVALGGNRQALLYKHHSDPNPGTVVRVDADADMTIVRQELIARLALDSADVLWWSPGS